MPAKTVALAFAQKELLRHDFSTFVEGDTRTVAQGGKGVVMPGCPLRKKKLSSIAQYSDHLAYDVLPRIFDRIFEGKP
jgi:hypothetical protein